jgi:hypothetical protein
MAIAVWSAPFMDLDRKHVRGDSSRRLGAARSVAMK